MKIQLKIYQKDFILTVNGKKTFIAAIYSFQFSSLTSSFYYFTFFYSQLSKLHLSFFILNTTKLPSKPCNSLPFAFLKNVNAIIIPRFFLKLPQRLYKKKILATKFIITSPFHVLKFALHLRNKND